MEKKAGCKMAKECEAVQCVRHSVLTVGPLKKYSVFLCILLFVSGVFSIGSTLAKLRNTVFPLIYFRADSEQAVAELLQGREVDETFWCDRSDNRTDICYMRGDVRLLTGNSTSLVLYSTYIRPWHYEEIIKPYARKWDNFTLTNVKRVLLKNKHEESPQNSSSDRFAVCDVVHERPLLVFSTGGFTGNLFHDFNDVIIPLFISSCAYRGEVVFGVTDGRDWWLGKFGPLFKLLSNHEIINIHRADKIHCFPEATIGLRVHGELAVYPSRMAHSETIKDFQQLLHQAFGGPEPDEALLKENDSSNCVAAKFREATNCSRSPHKLVVFSRKHTRTILNQDEVVKLAKMEGFDVEVLEPSVQTGMRSLYRSLQCADVMIGVHGAALTHILFMRPRSVFIQIVPLGTDWPAYTYFQEPAENTLDLQYIDYRVSPEESTLTSTYSINHLVVTDPETVIANDWELRKKMYLEKQDVRLSLARIALTLREAKRLVLEAFPLAGESCLTKG